MSKSFILILLVGAAMATVNCGGFDSSSGGNQRQNDGDNGEQDDGDSGVCTAPTCKCGSSVIVSWQNPTQRVDGTPLTDLAGIRIYYGLASRSYSTMIDHNNTGVTTRTISNLPFGQYYFAATAYTSDSLESTYSREVWMRLEDCVTVVYNPMTGRVDYLTSIGSQD